ncbi:MAG: glycosyltransferase family 4 protein, partial [Planctomycetota bacterium]
FIQQPVIPTYRVALFNALAKSPDYRVRLFASHRIPGNPDSVTEGLECEHHLDRCSSYFGDRAFWQHGASLPRDMGRGDILVFNSNPRFLSNGRLVMQAKTRGLRTIAWNHATSSSSGNISSAVRKRLSGWAAELLLVYTEMERERLCQEGVPPSRVRALNNTLDVEPMLEACAGWGAPQDTCPVSNLEAIRSTPGETLQAFRRESDLGGGPILLVCGRVTDKMRLDLLIEALHVLKQSRDQSLPKTVVIGSGPAEAPVKRLAAERGVADDLIWLGEIRDEQKLAPWFLSADLFVYPGAIGLSVVHAMAYGLPVITHSDARRQMPEFGYLRHGYNGMTFSPGRVSELADVIKETLSSGQLQTLSQHALQTVHERYTFRAMVDNFKAALDAVHG